MLRKIVFLPISGMCFANSYILLQLAELPGWSTEMCQLGAAVSAGAGTASAYIGLKPTKKKKCRCSQCHTSKSS